MIIGYRQDRYYWYFITMYLKVMLISITIILAYDVITMGLSLALVMAIYFTLISKYNPYEEV